MSSVNTRPYVLSIAGFDPSAGAGVLADVKTFESLNVYGMGVVSALTFQNDKDFEKVEWISIDQIIDQIKVLNKRFQFDYIKIGLIESAEILYELILNLKSQIPNSKLIWDPILKASAGFDFHLDIDKDLLLKICKQLYLITPNIPEMLKLGDSGDAKKNAGCLSQFCNVYLKGGHDEDRKGVDILFLKSAGELWYLPDEKFGVHSQKHGSGCVLSSAITANLSKGLSLENSCGEAKKYITHFLKSNDTLLGFHANPILMTHD
jgi:hydroxymethylpyrimidine/phosphomethylpyrimidine kinase